MLMPSPKFQCVHAFVPVGLVGLHAICMFVRFYAVVCLCTHVCIVGCWLLIIYAIYVGMPVCFFFFSSSAFSFSFSSFPFPLPIGVDLSKILGGPRSGQ